MELSDAAWRARHNAILVFLASLTGTVVVWAVVDGGTGHDLVEAAAMLVVTAVAAAVPRDHRRLAASVASVAMLLATAFLVHLSHGLIEMHFLFFVIVAAVTLYQQWAPFLSAVAFVALHHGLIGTIAAESIFNHDAAVDDPWAWAGLHAGFIALASVVGLAAWRFDELVREELAQAGRHNQVVLDSVRDAVIALDGAGTILTVNTRTTALVGRPASRLVGRPVHDALHPGATHPSGVCPWTTRPKSHDGVAGAETVHTGDDGRGRSPVRYVVGDVPAEGRARAVLTLTDVSSEQRAQRAEEQLVHLSAERQAERAQVAQLVASVQPPRLTVPDAELGATYLPAAEALIGGDLYDWFTGPDGTVHLAVIDAMGKGLAATNQALVVMHALRFLALDDCALGELFARADEILARHDPDLMATAIAARYQPDTGVLRVASAGHPPALVVRGSDGRADFLRTEGIGMGCPGTGSLALVEVTLHPGDALVLYTDGLIEGTRDIGRGLDELQSTAVRLSGAPAQVMTARLAVEPASVSVDDDRLTVVLRRL